MRNPSEYASFSNGTPALRGLSDPDTQTFNMDGINYAVDSAGNVWKQDGAGQWIPDSGYTATFRQIEANAPGAVAEAKSNAWGMQDILSSLSQIVSTVVTAKAQHDLLQTNLDRASKGLPPLNAQAYMPGVNVGVADDTKKMLYIIGGGLGAVLLVNAMRKR